MEQFFAFLRGRIATARKYGSAGRDYALFRTLYHAALRSEEGARLDVRDLRPGRRLEAGQADIDTPDPSLADDAFGKAPPLTLNTRSDCFGIVRLSDPCLLDRARGWPSYRQSDLKTRTESAKESLLNCRLFHSCRACRDQ